MCGVVCMGGISLQRVYKPAACGSGLSNFFFFFFVFCGCGVCGVSMQCVGYDPQFVLIGKEGNLLNDVR